MGFYTSPQRCQHHTCTPRVLPSAVMLLSTAMWALSPACDRLDNLDVPRLPASERQPPAPSLAAPAVKSRYSSGARSSRSLQESLWKCSKFSAAAPITPPTAKGCVVPEGGFQALLFGRGRMVLSSRKNNALESGSEHMEKNQTCFTWEGVLFLSFKHSACIKRGPELELTRVSWSGSTERTDIHGDRYTRPSLH